MKFGLFVQILKLLFFKNADEKFDCMPSINNDSVAREKSTIKVKLKKSKQIHDLYWV